MTDEYEDNPFDLMDDEEKAEFTEKYQSEIDRNAFNLSDREKSEIYHELNSNHNYVRSGNPVNDARRNFLEAKDAIRAERDSVDDHVKGYMDVIDREKGKGEGKKLLDRSRGAKDTGYLTDLERKGLI